MLSAARPRSFPLALTGLALGNFLASTHSTFSLGICVASILTVTCLQVLSNFANDYGDFVNGADNANRIGPARAVQSGSISLNAMKVAIGLLVGVSFISGNYLLYLSSKNVDIFALIGMLAIGLLAILAAVRKSIG